MIPHDVHTMRGPKAGTGTSWPKRPTYNTQFAFFGVSLVKLVRMFDPIFEVAVVALGKSRNNHVDPMRGVRSRRSITYGLADAISVRVHSRSRFWIANLDCLTHQSANPPI
jgi:hypothetical protein